MGKKRIVTIGAEPVEEKKKIKKIKEKSVVKDKVEREKKLDQKFPEKKEKEIKEKEIKEAKIKKVAEVEKEEKTKIKKVKIKPHKIKESKAYGKVVKLFDKNKLYSLDEAIELVKKTSITKFDSSVEIHIRLGIDPNKSEQMIRGVLVLPFGTGKTKRVLVFTETKNKEVEEAGADIVGGEELIQKIEKGFSDFDIVISTPEMMSKIARLGKILGRRGLMPNPKNRTITEKPAELVKEIKKGRIEFKTDPQGIIHQVVGKVSFDANKLKENIESLIKEINNLKPQGVKGDYIKSITLCTTMGPGIKVLY